MINTDDIQITLTKVKKDYYEIYRLNPEFKKKKNEYNKKYRSKNSETINKVYLEKIKIPYKCNICNKLITNTTASITRHNNTKIHIKNSLID